VSNVVGGTENQTASAAVSVERVSKSFIGTAGAPLAVLEDVSFSLRDGEIVALLGSSGCGKSTLLNIIAGLQRADSGRVMVAGREVLPRSVPPLGYVFQDDRLLPWRTALRNVTFSLEAGSTPQAEREARARKVLDLMNLGAFTHAYPHQLSGGMRSRVALARSLVLDPRILLMDEPFGRLDAQTRAQMHAEVLRLKELLSMSIIFVTHDVDEAVVLADRVLVMAPRPGRIKESVKIELPRSRDPTSGEAAIFVRELKRLIA
jgi:ABC-type nitrate/sulfonate/bicarbonate transport system ATPase subunit